MKTIQAATYFSLAMLLAGAGYVSADPIPYAGNGHYYELFSPSGGITWTDAKAAAESSSFLGFQGHLATVNSQREWDFIVANFPVDLTWIGLTDAGHEGDFQWVTDEPLGFTAWATGPTEPNGGTNENWVHYGHRSATGWGWNDFRNMNNAWSADAPFHYLAEYPVPEPSALVLLSLGAAALLPIGWRGRRRRR